MSERTGSLASKKCVPCKKGTPPLTESEIEPLLAQLDGWDVVEGHHLSRTFEFEDFQQALDFVNRAGAIAEREGHHPDVHLGWGRASFDIFTHTIGGLSESDFVLAAKIDQLDQLDRPR